MELPCIINSAADLAALAGTPAHAQAMAVLAGTLWRVTRDDQARQWRVQPDDAAIRRLGLKRADFGAPTPPPAPTWEDASPAPPPAMPMREARLALLEAGLLDQVEAAIDAIKDPTARQAARIEWEYATALTPDSPAMRLLVSGAVATETQVSEVLTRRAEAPVLAEVTPAPAPVQDGAKSWR
ncbi:MAG: hypothetical protein BGO36_10800 [Burkholderiales bacterium 68-10]|jgi:hypothetical protein|nr:MAG: hypothetical protein BGO36_10800 [Burkholderiales bacterium 68-10]